MKPRLLPPPLLLMKMTSSEQQESKEGKKLESSWKTCHKYWRFLSFFLGSTHINIPRAPLEMYCHDPIPSQTRCVRWIVSFKREKRHFGLTTGSYTIFPSTAPIWSNFDHFYVFFDFYIFQLKIYEKGQNMAMFLYHTRTR